MPAWLDEHNLPADTTLSDLRHDERLQKTLQEAVDYANRAVSKAEAIKSFRILPRDFSADEGEITPTLKLKRRVVEQNFAAEIDELYS